jgi:hypothetical protein
MFLAIGWTLAIKISSDPTQNYSNVPNTFHEGPTLDNTAPKIDTDAITIHFGQKAVKICIENPPSRQSKIALTFDPIPDPKDPPDSIKKPNRDNKILGNYESTLIVFATFSSLLILDMANNAKICHGDYGGIEVKDTVVFKTLW